MKRFRTFYIIGVDNLNGYRFFPLAFFKRDCSGLRQKVRISFGTLIYSLIVDRDTRTGEIFINGDFQFNGSIRFIYRWVMVHRDSSRVIIVNEYFCLLVDIDDVISADL